eukprot:scaffold1374_cov84-Cylindrotheca_fusiformis.AAC.2
MPDGLLRLDSSLVLSTMNAVNLPIAVAMQEWCLSFWHLLDDIFSQLRPTGFMRSISAKTC